MCHNRDMDKIAIVGGTSRDATYFKQALAGHATLHFYDKLDQVAPDTEILSVFVENTVGKDDLARLPALKLIACRSTGTNNVDVASAKARGILVTNVPSYGAAAVAEYAFALLLMLSRAMQTVIAESTKPNPDRLAEQG